MPHIDRLGSLNLVELRHGRKMVFGNTTKNTEIKDKN